MAPSSLKSSGAAFAGNALVRCLLFAISVLVLRFVYVVTIHGRSCASRDFCFLTSPPRRRDPLGAPPPPPPREVDFYASVFQDLIVEGFLSPGSKSLSFGSPRGHEVAALRRIGVSDSIGVGRSPSPPLVVGHPNLHAPFADGLFDFVFAGVGSIESSPSGSGSGSNPAETAREIARMVKDDWYLVVHTVSTGDPYSRNSLSRLFAGFRLLRFKEIEGPDGSFLREIVLQKDRIPQEKNNVGNNSRDCGMEEHRKELVRMAEPLIEEEPLKPWITLKKNLQNIVYLPERVDISLKRRYVYVDVGARSYGSSIGGWFKKMYPKQNRTFEVYAIEADGAFYDEYAAKKGVELLPYAAWVRNESISFEVNHDPDSHEDEARGKGMGRIRKSSELSGSENLHAVQGFDVAMWLKGIATEQDYVVVKMDVEGTEFDLIPRLIETGAICLVDEMFLECHYNRWQRCCPGVRTPKYKHTYGQCLKLFASLREAGVLVHQWW